MAISQLFISRTNLQHLHRKGLTRKVCCSYSTETPKKESMQTHSEAFPKAEQVPREVVGSLKSILLKIKKKMFNGPWNENGTTNATTSEVMKKEVTCKIQPPEIIITDALKMASSPSTVQMTESTHHKPLTSEASNIPVDQTSREVRETHERVEAAESDDRKQISEPSNSTLPVEPGNEYQQHKVVRSTREISNMLDSTVKSVVASSTENASKGASKASHVSTSGSSKKTSGLADLLEDDKLTVKTSSEQTNETSKDGLNTMQIKGLINQVKQIPRGTSEPRYEEISDFLTDCPPNDGGQAVSKVEISFSKLFTPDNLQKLDQPKSKKKKAKGKTTTSQMILKEKENSGYTKLIAADDDTANKVVSKNKCQKGNNSADTATVKNQSSPRIIPLPPKNHLPKKKDPNPLLFTEKGRDKTDILVRFVPKSQNVEDIKHIFSNCGPIEDIQFISSSDFIIFKDAYIRFKTKDGMRNALAKTDVSLTVSKGKYNLILEASSSSTYTTIKLQAPDLIGMPDVPPSLVINPTRTVMLMGLTDNISSSHLIDAFSFCGSRITGFFMGSSSSVAYIEFETEEAKEKVIAKFSICVSGTKLLILRIDSPITTIVRISNTAPGQDVGKLLKICNSYGKTQQIVCRGRGIFDVHYKLTEWPVMVNILNSLNGKVIGENQVVAQPATEIPVEILKYLWSHADGRRWVYSAIQCLCRRLEDCSMENVKVVAARYYEESIESVDK
ncbi:hypothetical protein ACHQM5_027581 [Ranunculus cassubicifolius]